MIPENSYKISLIAALSENRVIGADNRLPWNLPEDLKRFRALTTGHPVLMGRKTFESIGRPLPKRRNIVISRQEGWSRNPPAGVEGAPSCEAALDLVHSQPSTALQAETEKAANREIFIIGGGEIYRQMLPFADRLYLTWVHEIVQGDAVFPEWKEGGFQEVSRERHVDPASGVSYSFVTLDRVIS